MSDDDDDDQPVPKRTPSKLRRVRSRSPRSKDVPLKHTDSLEKVCFIYFFFIFVL